MESTELILQELKKINNRLDTLEGKMDKLQGDVTELREDVTELKESHEITRDGVNALLDWSDKISEAQRLPLPKI